MVFHPRSSRPACLTDVCEGAFSALHLVYQTTFLSVRCFVLRTYQDGSNGVNGPMVIFLFFSLVYPLPNVVALIDLPCISRSSAVRPTLHTLAPVQSSTSFSQDLFSLPPFICPFSFPSIVNSSNVWCLFICPK